MLCQPGVVSPIYSCHVIDNNPDFQNSYAVLGKANGWVFKISIIIYISFQEYNLVAENALGYITITIFFKYV